MGPKQKTSSVVFAITVLVVVAVYWSATANELLDYDDLAYTLENPMVARGFNLAVLRDVFTKPLVDFWIPLTALSHALTIMVFGADPFGHHLINVIVHGLTAGLWSLFLLRVPVRPVVAVMAAIGWAVHPLRVESVAWVAERKDVLSGFFFVLLLLVWARWARAQDHRSLWLALGVWLCVLWSKPLVAAPLVLMLLDVWPFERARFGRRDGDRFVALLIEKIPFLLLTVLSSVITFVAMTEGRHGPQPEPFDRLTNAFVSWVRYIGMTLWPVDLHTPYAFALQGWPVSTAVIATSLLLALWVWTFHIRSRSPAAFVGLVWFFAMSFPTIGLVGFGNAPLADRFTYTPSLGLFLFGAFLLEQTLRSEASLRMRWLPPFLLASLVVLQSVWIHWTRRQIAVWHDSVSLFSHAVAVAPDNQAARYHLAARVAFSGDLPRALSLLDSIPVMERGPGIHRLRGELLLRRGDARLAIEEFVEALTANVDDCDAHLGLARALEQVGEDGAAHEERRRAERCRTVR